MQLRTATRDLPVAPEDEVGVDPGHPEVTVLGPPGSNVAGPAKEETTSAPSPVPSVWLRIVDTPGVLLWTAALTLTGGAFVHASVDRLPASYSWSLPFRTLRNVVGSPGFPVWALAAFTIGAFHKLGWGRIRSEFGALLANLRHFRDRGPPVQLLRPLPWVLLAAVAALVLDALAFPTHEWPDLIAAALATAIVAAQLTRRRMVTASLNVAVGVIVFAAVCYWFTILKTLTFTDGAQWDAQIATLEREIFGVYPHRWVAAIFSSHPNWVRVMDRTYFAIFEHMAVGTCFLLGLGDARERGRYLGALCLSYAIGAPLYLCMPAAGPAYFDPSSYAFLRQQPLVVNYVQAVLFENTAAINEARATSIQTWGYIACMPSLHMAHELVMLYFARRSLIFFTGTLVFFVMTAVSVVALGWHYPTDILTGMALGAVSIVISHYLGVRWSPRGLRSG